MKKLIVGVAWHEDRVRTAVGQIQENGGEVILIFRVSSSFFFGMFGEDVTEITYFEKR